MSESKRSWWSNIWRKRSEDWLFQRLEPAQTPDQKPIEPLDPGQYYVNIFLKSMRVVNVRKGLSKFYGTVHSHISLPHLTQETAEFNAVITPTDLKDVDAKNIDKVITMDKRLLGPVPYRGGDLNLELGLFSIKAVDLAAPYLDLLGSLAQKASVSFINAAMPFVDPIKEGFELLTGSADDTILEVGINRDFNPVETGYYVVVAAPKDEVDLSSYRIDPGDFKLEDQKGTPLADYPYFIFEVTRSQTRSDWFSIPELREKHNQLNDDIQHMRDTQAKESLKILRRYLLTSPDLLRNDAVKVFQSIEAEAAELLGDTQVTRSGTGSERGLTPLEEMNPFD